MTWVKVRMHHGILVIMRLTHTLLIDKLLVLKARRLLTRVQQGMILMGVEGQLLIRHPLCSRKIHFLNRLSCFEFVFKGTSKTLNNGTKRYIYFCIEKMEIQA